ncbi:hypothetical protein UFOVP1462_45 [uncultured Caudovirales phage]|uniref:Uncharacterized protein n=1 Tax=uncultured Caudovirales phage TaxID=2100421 RepID=A0A6J5RV57_9CAUD|nr:hypothetical protein UFOVP1013_45 [uncultured Caudovirales phage]CAB4202363.1 hypothetical protein UFOVP1364_7 [uncultured Caudovirales phage]CAB4214536.1 hypothetical protein UFOVP1462_45 [uncultured Caudovirales phage]CAB5228892.1 hypothetical protein UFOVP1550_54 [uncultured Caudovirales phage]
MRIESLIISLSRDPFNPELNYQVATEYEALRQTASAVSFYLRTAEYGYATHQDIVYLSLLKLAGCFHDQNDRLATVSNALLQAVAYQPDKVEGYFLLSEFYERQKNWQECYTFAAIGLNLDKNDYRLLFEKAASGWWIGRAAESKRIFNTLIKRKDLPAHYRKAIELNLASI